MKEGKGIVNLGQLSIGFLFFAIWIHPANAEKVTFEDCFLSAAQKNELIKTEDQRIEVARENVSQSVGSVLPSIFGTVSYLHQATPPSNLGTTFFPTDQATVRIAANQPIFRGFREFAGIRQSKDLVGQQEQQRDQSLVQLFNDVATSFYDIWTWEADIKNYEKEIETHRKRYKELQGYAKVGRSRQAEVVVVESTIATLEARVAIAQGQSIASRNRLAFVTGLSADLQIEMRETYPKMAPDVETLLAMIENRPDVRGAKKAVDAADEAIWVAKGAHLPTIDLLGNYYITRPGVLSGVNWDIQLLATVPIFSGGVTRSQVRQASSELRIQELALHRLTRLARQEIIGFHAVFKSDLEQIQKLKEAVRLRQKAVDYELKDFKLGLSTNLEVLLAIVSAQETQREYDRAKIATQLDWERLQSAIFKIPLEKLG